MIHLRTIGALMMLSLGVVAITNAAYADSSDDSANATQSSGVKTKLSKKDRASSRSHAKSESINNSSGLAGQTDIVAKVDLPMVTNITPWRDADEGIPKNILEFSVLKDSLTPTDRDKLDSEIRYTSILNQPLDQK